MNDEKPLIVTNHGRDRYCQRVGNYKQGTGEALVLEAYSGVDELDEEITRLFEESIPVSYRPRSPNQEGVNARIHPETYEVVLFSSVWSDHDDYLCDVNLLVTTFNYAFLNSRKLPLLSIRRCACGFLYWPHENDGCPSCNAPEEDSDLATDYFEDMYREGVVGVEDVEEDVEDGLSTVEGRIPSVRQYLG